MRETVTPPKRLEYLKRHLRSHEAVNLVVTEATGAKSFDARGPFAHSLTIIKKGDGFLVQDIAVDADGNFTVSEHSITRKGKFVQEPGTLHVTNSNSLTSLMNDKGSRPHAPHERIHARRIDTVLDRLVIEQELTNDTREYTTSSGILVRRSELDAILRHGCEQYGFDSLATLLRNGQIDHPMANIIARLKNLAAGRAAQVQLSRTLNETGLAGFTFSGDDPM
jgi:hypothetical protein